jgi:hypothetical protein
MSLPSRRTSGDDIGAAIAHKIEEIRVLDPNESAPVQRACRWAMTEYDLLSVDAATRRTSATRRS